MDKSSMMTNVVHHADWNGKGEVLLIDKPVDWTSFDVVKKVRSLFHIRKAGHAGTLDPLATGLLIVCTGAQTKNVDRFAEYEKEYEGKMELGVRTASHDSETPEIERRNPAAVTSEVLRETARGFLGKQKQTPPMYSAVKMEGKPLYRYARKGRSVERAKKDIEIKEFEILTFESPFLYFRVICSKGTYIRVLTDDMGQRLGCGAVLRALRRTRIGPHRVEEALTIDQLISSAPEPRQRRSIRHEDFASAE